MQLDTVGRSPYVVLRELPSVCTQLYNDVASRGGEGTAAYIANAASRGPGEMAELARSLARTSDTPRKALALATQLMGMAVRGQAAESDSRSFYQLAEISGGFGLLYLPVMTQRPDLGLAITKAALNEPNMPLPGRERVAVAFADASFSTLRRAPEQTLEVLGDVVRHSAEPGAPYLSPSARREVVEKFTRTLDTYPPHFDGQPARVSVNGGVLSLPAETVQHTTSLLARLTPDAAVRQGLEARNVALAAKREKFAQNWH